MKLSYKLVAVACVAATGAVLLPGYKDVSKESLPQSWVMLPEDAPSQNWAFENAGISSDEDTKGAQTAVDRFLGANAAALESLDVAPTTKEHWGLAGYMVDLGVTHSGMIGGLFAQGEASATVYWHKMNASGNVTMGQNDSPPDVVINANTSPSELYAQLEPVAKAVVASGKVNKIVDFRENLEKTAKNFLEITQGVQTTMNSEWAPSRIRLDFLVDAEGRLNPFFSQGAGVHLRFEWQPMPASASLERASNDDDNNSNLKELVQTLAHDLMSIDASAYEPTGYKVNEIRFGIGAYGTGRYGLAKVSTSVMGHVYFARNPAFVGHSALEDAGLATLPVVEENPLPSNLQYARATGVNFATIEESNKPKEVVYDVVRERFRAGLEKAGKMALFLAGEPSKVHESKWQVAEIRTSFALSLSGTTSFVTLAGLQGAIQFSMTRR